MRKLRSDALWHKLTSEQQNQIQHWLFVEHLSYVQTHHRMRQELGITCALSTIGPLYHHLSESRSRERETILQKLTEVITEPGADIAGIRADSLADIVRRLMNRSERRDSTREIVALSRVLVRGETCDIRRLRAELALENRALHHKRTASPSAASGQPAKPRDAQSESSDTNRREATQTGLNRDKPQ